MTTNKTGVITLGEKTKGHIEALRSLGYEPQVVESEIHTPVSGFVEDLLDLTDGNEPLKAVVEAKQALTYNTRVRFPDGKVLFSFGLCARLGQLSCLVMKPQKAAKVAKSAFSVQDLLKV